MEAVPSLASALQAVRVRPPHPRSFGSGNEWNAFPWLLDAALMQALVLLASEVVLQISPSHGDHAWSLLTSVVGLTWATSKLVLVLAPPLHSGGGDA